jgi:hypothetical protein
VFSFSFWWIRFSCTWNRGKWGWFQGYFWGSSLESGWWLDGNTWCSTEAPKELLRFVNFDWDTSHFPFSLFIICSVEVAWKYCEVHWIWKVKCKLEFLSVGSWYKTSQNSTEMIWRKYVVIIFLIGYLFLLLNRSVILSN